ncbi:MAG: VTC domain-containing protein, partial [Candidatus Latescibacteria bacterium]|nr:VTC domain-containing protein [Candidatus Latescibacterota bacterium]
WRRQLAADAEVDRARTALEVDQLQLQEATARLEYKYLIPASALDLVRRRLEPFVEPDCHRIPGRDQYTIRSIYFDTRGLDYYYQKESGIQHRRKLRLRGYNQRIPSSRGFLEIKRKDDMAVSKARASCLFDEVGCAGRGLHLLQPGRGYGRRGGHVRGGLHRHRRGGRGAAALIQAGQPGPEKAGIPVAPVLPPGRRRRGPLFAGIQDLLHNPPVDQREVL